MVEEKVIQREIEKERRAVRRETGNCSDKKKLERRRGREVRESEKEREREVSRSEDC